MADPNFSSRIIAAYTAGQQLRRQKEQQAQEAEDRKNRREIELEDLDIRRKQLKFEKKKEELALRQGQPGEEMAVNLPQASTMPISQALNGEQQAGSAPPPMSPTFTEGGGTMQMPLPAAPITFGQEEGFDTSFSVRPQTMQQQLLAMQRKRQQEIFDKAREAEAVEAAKAPYSFHQISPGSAGILGAGTPGAQVIQGPAKPKNFQAKEIVGPDGKPIMANYDADSGQFFDQDGKPVQNARPYEKPPDPTLEQIRQLTLANLQNQMAAGRLTPAQFTQAQRIHDDFMKNSKDFITRRDSFENIQSAAAQPSAAGDLSLIFAYMRMLDPGSTVREGEFANAQNAAGVPDRIRNLYNKALSGERLNENQRKDFVGQAKTIYQNALKNHNVVKNFYSASAKSQGIPVESVVMDLTATPSGASVSGGGKVVDFNSLPK